VRAHECINCGADTRYLCECEKSVLCDICLVISVLPHLDYYAPAILALYKEVKERLEEE
jgi:hypothetical protein